MGAWLCIDAGTSVIKTAVLDSETGAELAAAKQAITVSRPTADRSEQNMALVWNTVIECSRAAIRQPNAAIEGIVSTAQGDGCWLVDEHHQPAGPAILWNDGRAHQLIEGWRRAGIVEAAYRRSGSVTYPGLPNAIWRSLAALEPARLQRARWSLTCNGWLFLCFTGQAAADLSDASNPFGNVVQRVYDPELLRLYGVEAYAHLLPPLIRAPQAPLLADVAAALGATAGIPVLMAPYDIVATAAGTDCTRPGDGCVILGTTICAEVITTGPGLTGLPAGTTIALDDPNLYLRAMPTLTGCEALTWAAQLLHADGLLELAILAAQSPVGAHGVTCLPYLSPAGERAPFLAPSARASLHGMSLTHTPADVARAVYESLSFVIRECAAVASPAAPLTRLAVCGGGARSDFWCQLIADVCRCEVTRPQSDETGIRGAFRHATGVAGSQPGRLFPPDFARAAQYDELYPRFLRLRDAVAPVWDFVPA